MLTGILLTLAAVACFEASYVLQTLEVRAVAAMPHASFGALRGLAARPVWLAAIVLGLAGFGLQVLALRHVPLSLAQPLLAVGLLGLLAFSATVLGEHVGRREIGAVFAIIAGVTAIALADPQRGDDAAPGLAFLIVAGALGLLALSAFVPRARRSGSTGLLAAAVAADALAALARRRRRARCPACCRASAGACWRRPAASPPWRRRAPSCSAAAPRGWLRSCSPGRSRCRSRSPRS